MSDQNHQDQESVPGTPGEGPDEPIAPSHLKDAEDAERELKRETVRQTRVTTQRFQEEVNDFRFNRKALVAVLCILGLVASGSFVVIVAEASAGAYRYAVGTMVPLFGSGSLSFLAWRTYLENRVNKPEPLPAGESP